MGIDDPRPGGEEGGGGPHGRLQGRDFLPPHQAQALDTVGEALLVEGEELLLFLLVLGDDQLTRAPVGHAVFFTPPIEEPTARDAQAGLQEGRGVVDAGMDDLAVARACLPAETIVLLQDGDPSSAVGETGRHGQADDARPDDDGVKFRHGVSEMGEGGLADGVDIEAHLEAAPVVEDVAPVEEKGRLYHLFPDPSVIESAVEIPLRHDADGMGADRRLVRILHELDGAADTGQVGPGVLQGPGVRDDHLGLFLQEALGDVDGGTLPRVARVGLEGEAEEAYPLPRQGVEHGREHLLDETFLLVDVDLDHPFPVIGHLVETVESAKVNEVQDVLLEAGPAETDAGVEEPPADAAVQAHGPGDLRDVRLRLLAEGGDGVDGRDALGEKGVGHQFRQLAAPDVGGDDLLPRDPAAVDLHQGIPRPAPPVRVPGTDEDPVGVFQVPDGRSLGEEFGVGEDLEFHTALGRGENPLHGQGRFHGEGALLDDDLGRAGVFQDLAGRLFPVSEIRRHPRPDAEGLGGGVDADEDDVVVPDGPFDIRREKEIFPPRLGDDLVQARFVDGQAGRVPGGDPLRVDVHDGDPVIGAFFGDDGHGRTAHVAGPDAEDVFLVHGLSSFGSVSLKGLFGNRRSSP